MLGRSIRGGALSLSNARPSQLSRPSSVVRPQLIKLRAIDDDDLPPVARIIDPDTAKPDEERAAEIARAALRTKSELAEDTGGIIKGQKPAKINPRGPPRDKIDKNNKPRPRGYDKTQAAALPPPGIPVNDRGAPRTFDPSRVRTNSGGPGRGAPGGNKYGGGRGDGKQAGNWNNRSGAGGRGAGVKAGENKSWPGKTGSAAGKGNAGSKKPGTEPGRRMTGSSIRARAERRREERKAVQAGNRKGDKEEIIEVAAGGMPVTELAEKIACTPADIVKILFMRGMMVSVNQTLDRPTVKIVCEARGVEVWDAEAAAQGASAKDAFLDAQDVDHLTARPPVVTVMGHVDHGKTSLLDYIRKARVAQGEAGGITQRIGAYNVSVKDLQVSDAVADSICFFDTPGHEAFSAMRARGAQVTDIAIIIVAADDGVRPQTLEAISHAKAAKVPIIVAINKIDKDGANPEKVKTELAEAGLVPEEWGGETPMVPISAKAGTGVNDLLETVLLVSELLELQANADKAAKGTVIEAAMDPRRGAVATVLVQTGTLKVGDIVQVGSNYGRIRAMTDDRGQPIEAATPSTAVQMFGLNGVPLAGQVFQVFESDADARTTAEGEGAKERSARLAEQSTSSLASLSSMDGEDGVQRINLIIKADAAGSLEAIKSALGQLPQDRILLRFVLTAPGDVSENDINLAAASQASVIAFNIAPSEATQAAAKRMNVDVRAYRVIYDLLDDMRAAMEGRLAPIEERIPMGKAEVKAVFGGGPSGKVAGCAVVEGRMSVGTLAVVRRKKRVMAEGKLSSLRRIKDQVKEVEAGKECGLGVEGFKDWEVGDVIESYEVVRRSRTLEEASAAKTENQKNAKEAKREAVGV